MLRKASVVDWTLAYHDNTGLVSNELTVQGRSRLGVRKISVLHNDKSAFAAEVVMTGIRLEDFAAGLPYAAFLDLDGKVGLISRSGRQALDGEGQPLRFTYIGRESEGRIPACRAEAALGQTGISAARLFREFNVQVVNRPGTTISNVKSSGAASVGIHRSGRHYDHPIRIRIGGILRFRYRRQPKRGQMGRDQPGQRSDYPLCLRWHLSGRKAMESHQGQ